MAPYRRVRALYTIFPTIEPRQMIDPDHDVSAVVNGPESNGVSDDCSSGSAGENHPMAQPNPSITMLAVEREN